MPPLSAISNAFDALNKAATEPGGNTDAVTSLIDVTCLMGVTSLMGVTPVIGVSSLHRLHFSHRVTSLNFDKATSENNERDTQPEETLPTIPKEAPDLDTMPAATTADLAFAAALPKEAPDLTTMPAATTADLAFAAALPKEAPDLTTMPAAATGDLVFAAALPKKSLRTLKVNLTKLMLVKTGAGEDGCW